MVFHTPLLQTRRLVKDGAPQANPASIRNFLSEPIPPAADPKVVANHQGGAYQRRVVRRPQILFIPLREMSLSQCIAPSTNSARPRPSAVPPTASPSGRLAAAEECQFLPSLCKFGRSSAP